MSDLVGERGVSAFTSAALDLGWIVRRQNESVQGIDAQVEKVDMVARKNGAPKQVATGRLIAVQIKSGESWFRRPTKTGGWWFPFTERERNLWLNHALPVIVAAYHPEHDEVCWQRISAATTTKPRRATALRSGRARPSPQRARSGTTWRAATSGEP